MTSRGLSPREQHVLRQLEAQFTAPGRDPRAAQRALTVALAVQAAAAFAFLLVFIHRAAETAWALYAFTSTWTSTLITFLFLQRRRLRQPDYVPERRGGAW
jgi:hypothetical protein